MVLTLIQQGLGLRPRPREQRALCGKMQAEYSRVTQIADQQHDTLQLSQAVQRSEKSYIDKHKTIS